MFLGRDRELAELNRLYAQERFQCFVLYGRRRVGKTTLLNAFCRDKDAIFFSAEVSNDKRNLDKFSQVVQAHYGEIDMAPFASWVNAWSHIVAQQQGRPLVLVLDEFPYLADKNPEVLSNLQHFIDHHLQDSRIFLILCGSYVGFMEREVLGQKSPLFGRRTGQLLLKPLDYLRSRLFLPGFTFCGRSVISMMSHCSCCVRNCKNHLSTMRFSRLSPVVHHVRMRLQRASVSRRPSA